MGRAVADGIPELPGRRGRTLRRNAPMPGLGAPARLDHGRRTLAGGFRRGGFLAIAGPKTVASRADGPRRGQLVAVSVEISADEHRRARLAEHQSARIRPVIRKRGIRMEVALAVVGEEPLVRKAVAAELLAIVRAFLQHGASVAEAVQHEERGVRGTLEHRLVVQLPAAADERAVHDLGMQAVERSGRHDCAALLRRTVDEKA